MRLHRFSDFVLKFVFVIVLHEFSTPVPVASWFEVCEGLRGKNALVYVPSSHYIFQTAGRKRLPAPKIQCRTGT